MLLRKIRYRPHRLPSGCAVAREPAQEKETRGVENKGHADFFYDGASDSNTAIECDVEARSNRKVQADMLYLNTCLASQHGLNIRRHPLDSFGRRFCAMAFMVVCIAVSEDRGWSGMVITDVYPTRSCFQIRIVNLGIGYAT